MAFKILGVFLLFTNLVSTKAAPETTTRPWDYDENSGLTEKSDVFDSSSSGSGTIEDTTEPFLGAGQEPVTMDDSGQYEETRDGDRNTTSLGDTSGNQGPGPVPHARDDSQDYDRGTSGRRDGNDNSGGQSGGRYPGTSGGRNPNYPQQGSRAGSNTGDYNRGMLYDQFMDFLWYMEQREKYQDGDYPDSQGNRGRGQYDSQRAGGSGRYGPYGYGQGGSSYDYDLQRGSGRSGPSGQGSDYDQYGNRNNDYDDQRGGGGRSGPSGQGSDYDQYGNRNNDYDDQRGGGGRRGPSGQGSYNDQYGNRYDDYDVQRGSGGSRPSGQGRGTGYTGGGTRGSDDSSQGYRGGDRGDYSGTGNTGNDDDYDVGPGGYDSGRQQGSSGRDGGGGGSGTRSRRSVFQIDGNQTETGERKYHAGRTDDDEYAADCAELFKNGNDESGVYTIRTTEQYAEPFRVYCDMKTDGGGWTLIQRRGEYSGTSEDDFYGDWESYKYGFGNLKKEFWIGNERIFALTNQGVYDLRIDMWKETGQTAYATYTRFRITDEDSGYKLRIGTYSGNAGDALSYHRDMEFSTSDSDNDRREGQSCSQMYRGAWWYNNCLHSNLNGLNLRGRNNQANKGIVWYEWTGDMYSIPDVEMKIRPQDF